MLTTKENPRLPTSALSGLLQAGDWDELREGMRGPMQELQICDFMLKIEVASPCAPPAGHLFGTLPQALLNLFCNVLEQKSDPVTKQFATCSLPFAWRIEQLCTGKASQAYLLLRTKGVCHGLSMATRTEYAVSRIDFYGNMPDSFVCAGERLADALLAGVYLHQATELLWRRNTPAPAALLSAREIECLGWSAAGKTSQETGAILGISHRTVYFHLKNVATKLDVYSTRHAVSRAISMGLIKPSR
jgi:DNA-binding CsgD family transcriptional regulator